MKANVSEKDVKKLKRVTGPAFIAGIDVETEEGYLVSVTKRSPKKYAGIPCTNKINCTLIEKLWKQAEKYWSNRNMLAAKSVLS